VLEGLAGLRYEISQFVKQFTPRKFEGKGDILSCEKRHVMWVTKLRGMYILFRPVCVVLSWVLCTCSWQH